MSVYSSEGNPVSTSQIQGYRGAHSGAGIVRCVWADGVSTAEAARSYVYRRMLDQFEEDRPDDVLYLHCGERRGVELLSRAGGRRYLEVGWDAGSVVVVDGGRPIERGHFSVPLFKRLGLIHAAGSRSRAVVAEEVCSRCGDPHDLFLNLSYFCRSGESVIVLDDFRSTVGDPADDIRPDRKNGGTPGVLRRLRRYPKLQDAADAAFTHGFRLTDCVDLTPCLQIDWRLHFAAIHSLLGLADRYRAGDEGIRGPWEYRRLLDQGLLRYILVTFTRFR